jgi:predicted TIM-barrel fold metal-dependent hydrolase
MTSFGGSPEWLGLVKEEIVDPERVIVDPHHHLWKSVMGTTYLLDDLWSDTGSGHNVVQTVFVECGAEYHESGPEQLRVIGETEFVAGIAKESAAGPGATIAGIVAHADLTRGDVAEVLDAHEAAGAGLFRGIRHALSRAEHPEALMTARACARSGAGA